jgi:hypothetical protein
MCSGHLRRPALAPGHVIGPTLAAAGQVLAMGDQPLVQLTGEQRDAVQPGVVSEPVAGHADLAAAGFKQGALIEVGPLLDRGFEPGIQRCRPGERGTHESWLMRTPVLARLAGFAAVPLHPRYGALSG